MARRASCPGVGGAHAGRAPLADLRLFRHPSFRYGNITALIVMLGEFGVIFTLPLFCQVVLGFGTLTTGWVFASLSAGALVAGATVPRLARRFEVRKMIIGGMILGAVVILLGACRPRGCRPDARTTTTSRPPARAPRPDAPEPPCRVGPPGEPTTHSAGGSPYARPIGWEEAVVTSNRRSATLPVHRLDTLPERLSRYPTPVGGLALGIASLGLAWERALPGTSFAEVAAAVAAVLLLLMTLRFALHPDTLARDLANPIVGGVVPTYAMGWMIVSISIHQVSDLLGTAVWLVALGLHVVFLITWARHQARSFQLARMVPSWFVPPVGVIVAAVSYRGPDSGLLHGLALVALYFGMISYAVMLPVMFYRFIFSENVPVAAMPTLGILAAPASLSLVGYLTLVQDPEPLPVILLEGIAVLMTTIVYVAFVRLLALPFTPGFAAYTFPMAIGATAQFTVATQLTEWGSVQDLVDQVHALAMVELWVATAVIAFVCLRFLQFAWVHWSDAHGATAEDA
jgi:tellurite resistance protein TehA-like permease